ncbi:hypothetical protein CK516_01775 [Nostoc sp. 'Peltigera malacea cyanobiont' DB3992]|nr:hypothetical protein CK516_01775 [Nostoc sp. 'Peltigera malacea cyanobiont' DB3992]
MIEEECRIQNSEFRIKRLSTRRCAICFFGQNSDPCLLTPDSCLLPPASCLLPPVSCLLPPALSQDKYLRPPT